MSVGGVLCGLLQGFRSNPDMNAIYIDHLQSWLFFASYMSYIDLLYGRNDLILHALVLLSVFFIPLSV